MRINRFLVKPKRLGLGEETLWILLLSLSSHGLAWKPESTSRSAECRVTPESTHDAKWAELLITS